MKHELSKMMALDIYLSNLNPKDKFKFEDKIGTEILNMPPLLSWDIYSGYYMETLKSIKKDNDIQHISEFAQKFKWQNSIETIFKNENFEAIVLTDLHQKIVWVNDGFTQMTGYSKKDAVNKSPKFLQGPKTSESAKLRFRENLQRHEPFTEVITNYKKNKDAYNCEVKIFPLYSEEITHYIALERRVG